MKPSTDDGRPKDQQPSGGGVDESKRVALKPKAAVPPFRSAMVAPAPDVVSQRSALFPSASCLPYAAAPRDQAAVSNEDTSKKPITAKQHSRPCAPFGKTKEHSMTPIWRLKMTPVAPNRENEKPSSAIHTWDTPLTEFSYVVGWTDPILIKLPRHYPLERTHVVLKLGNYSLSEFIRLLSKRFQKSFYAMSIQAKYMDNPAAVALLTPENVELYVALWESGSKKAITVEVQRRRGDAVIAQQYARFVLQAASGDFDASQFPNDEGSILYLRSTETKLKEELAKMELPGLVDDLNEESTVAMEIVYGLLTKDRRDTRRLGMEGVCVLVNPRKTVLSAAIRASRALLLGEDQNAASQGIHEFVIDIIQKRSIGTEQVGGDYLEDSDEEQYFVDDDEALRDRSPEDREEMTLLFNLALDALAHALEVATTFDLGVASKGSISQVSTSAAWIAESFLVEATQLTEKDVLATMLEAVQRADSMPHNAWLATKCIRYMCGVSTEVAQRTKKYGGMQWIAEAFDYGRACHAKLESECRQLQRMLGGSVVV